MAHLPSRNAFGHARHDILGVRCNDPNVFFPVSRPSYSPSLRMPLMAARRSARWEVRVGTGSTRSSMINGEGPLHGQKFRANGDTDASTAQQWHPPGHYQGTRHPRTQSCSDDTACKNGGPLKSRDCVHLLYAVFRCLHNIRLESDDSTRIRGCARPGAMLGRLRRK